MTKIVNCLSVYKVKEGFFSEGLTLYADFCHCLGFTGPLCSKVSFTTPKAEELYVPIANRHFLNS